MKLRPWCSALVELLNSALQHQRRSQNKDLGRSAIEAKPHRKVLSAARARDLLQPCLCCCVCCAVRDRCNPSTTPVGGWGEASDTTGKPLKSGLISSGQFRVTHRLFLHVVTSQTVKNITVACRMTDCRGEVSLSQFLSDVKPGKMAVSAVVSSAVCRWQP